MDDLSALCSICHKAAHDWHEQHRRDGLWCAVKTLAKKWQRYTRKTGKRNGDYSTEVARFFGVDMSHPFVTRPLLPIS
jgi:hypothetical protein